MEAVTFGIRAPQPLTFGDGKQTRPSEIPGASSWDGSSAGSSLWS